MIICGLPFRAATAQIEEFQDEWNEKNSAIWETLEFNNKLNLNKTSVDELIAFGFNMEQAQCMLDHQEKFGNWHHESELQQCDIELEFIRTHRQDWSPILVDSRLTYFMENRKTPYIPQLSVTSSFNNNLGSLKNPTWHSQVQFKWGKLARLVYTTQTDAGEKSFDFQTAALEINSLKHLKKLVVGKYQWNWNHGLVFAAPYSIGRSYNLGSWVNNYQELRSAISTNEDQGVWGLGSTWQIRKNEFYVSLGTAKIDTRLNESGTSFLKRNYGGLHIGELEKSRRHNNQLNQIFGGWKRQFQNHSFNFSGVYYTYSIPRFRNFDSIYHEYIYEFQHTLNRFLKGKMLFNIAANNSGNWSFYSAGAWSLSSKFDLAFRIQSIPESFYSPERSPFSQSDIGNKTSEMGFDFNPNKQHCLQIRSIQILNISQLSYPRDDHNSFNWTMQYIHKINRSDYVQFRWKKTHSILGHPLAQVFIQTKLNIGSKFTSRFVFLQNRPSTTNEENTALLGQISGKIGPLNLQLYTVRFFSASPMYLTLPSAQFPWKLGVFTGNGTNFGFVLRYRVHKNARLLFSLDATKKNSFLEDQSQKPRIFVQLEIL